MREEMAYLGLLVLLKKLYQLFRPGNIIKNALLRG